jgi:hypothetical protein
LPATVVDEPDGDTLQGREQVRQIARPLPGVDYAGLMFEPGDAVVTRRSLLGGVDTPGHGGVNTPGLAEARALDRSNRASDVPAISDHWVSSCAEHRGMTGDPTLLRGLLRVLFSPTPPRDPGV